MDVTWILFLWNLKIVTWVIIYWLPVMDFGRIKLYFLLGLFELIIDLTKISIHPSWTFDLWYCLLSTEFNLIILNMTFFHLCLYLICVYAYCFKKNSHLFLTLFAGRKKMKEELKQAVYLNALDQQTRPLLNR